MAKAPKTSGKRIEKHAGRELGRLMFERQVKEESKYKKGEEERVFKQAIKNISEHCYWNCVYCDEFVEFPQDTHRGETIKDTFFWIGKCPECGGWNYQNIYTTKFKSDTGEVETVADTRWYKEEEVTGERTVELRKSDESGSEREQSVS